MHLRARRCVLLPAERRSEVALLSDIEQKQLREVTRVTSTVQGNQAVGSNQGMSANDEVCDEPFWLPQWSLSPAPLRVRCKAQPGFPPDALIQNKVSPDAGLVKKCRKHVFRGSRIGEQLRIDHST